MIRFGIVGTGAMAARMIAAIGLSGEAQAVRIASGSGDRAREFADEQGIAAWGSLADLVADPAVDAVYVAGRNQDHAAATIAALGAGKAVLCEKPFACSLDEAEAVLDAAKQANVPFMEAVATPFLPAVAEAIARARSGEYGVARRLTASFGYPADRRAQAGLFTQGAGVLLDRAVYPLTLALLTLGPVVSHETDGEIDDAGIDIAVRIRLDHAGGGRSELAASLVETLPNRMTILCEGSRIAVAPPLLTAQRLRIGNAALLDFADQPRAAQNPILRRIGDAAARATGGWLPFGASPYLPELRHFCAMVRAGQGESDILTHAIMRDVQRIIAGAREAG